MINVETRRAAGATTGVAEVFSFLAARFGKLLAAPLLLLIAMLSIATPAAAQAPVITSISPASGPPEGGNRVEISGINFYGMATVTVGGQSATIFDQAAGSTTIYMPPSTNGALGDVEVEVTTPFGVSTPNAASRYTYAPAAVTPTVTSVSPNTGPNVGGTTVTITGTGFTGVTGASAVRFGTTNAASYTVNSDTQITAVTPAVNNTVNVTVTNTAGTSATSAANEYAFRARPAVTSLSPGTGTTAGGNTVVISGTSLLNATAVTFGGTPAIGYVVNNNNQITATAPAGTGTVNVQVATAGGTSAPTVGSLYFYMALPPAPAVTAVSPTAGPTAGGRTVTITGTNFSDATAVMFGGSAAMGYNIDSDTQITATAPAGSPGTVDIRITTPSGTSAISAADQFTYGAAPTVTAVSPALGNAGGGTTVVITGTGFTGATAVVFGARSAVYTVNSDTQITATSPGGSGTVDILVTTPYGTSATSAADQFTFAAAPGVVMLSPQAGPIDGGTTVTITGIHLWGATAVTFGATPATGYTVIDGNTIVATSPPGAVGAVDVRVTTQWGRSPPQSVHERFNYVPATTVTSVSPSTGLPAGGTPVTIQGTSFGLTTAVMFGGTAATSFTVVNNNTINAIAPVGTGTVDVRVTAMGGTSAISAADRFTYADVPTVTAVSPTAGPTGGGTSVVITGTGFSTAAPTGAVKFGATNATYSIDSDTRITATSPANSAGTYDVTVTTPAGTSATSAADQFTYVPAPTVTSVSPTAGPTGGGTTVTITGTNLSGATAVTFGATPATGFVVNSGTQITATAPAGAVGTVDIRITTVGGTSAISAADRFNYIVPVPVVSSFTAPQMAYNSAADTPSNFSLSAHATNSPTSYSISASANGAVVSVDNAGLVSYTPPIGFHGDDSFTFTATNAGGMSNTATVTVPVESPSLSASLPSTVGMVGAAYNSAGAAVTVSGGVGPYSFNITNLPAGLTANSSGVISGTPTTATSALVQIEVTDSSRGVGPYSETFVEVLNIGAPMIEVIPLTLPNPQIGVAYSQTMLSTGGVGLKTYAVTAGALPAGLSLASDGLISGKPTESGSFNVTITATDSSGNGYTGSRNYVFGVDGPNITLSPTVLHGMTVGEDYFRTFSAANGTAPYSYAVTDGALPAGLTLNPATGQLTGTPTASGDFSFEVTATDSTTGSMGPFRTGARYWVTVNAPTLVLSPASLPAGKQEIAYSQTFTTSGGTPGYSYAVVGSLPAGLTLSTGGVLSGASTVNGIFDFEVQVTDSTTGDGPATKTMPYSLVIAAPNPPTAGPVTVDVDANGSGPVTLNLSGTTAKSLRVGSQARNGVVTVNGLTISYTPTPGFSGTDTFTYFAANDGGESAEATVTITVAAPVLTLSGVTTIGQVAVPYSATATAQLGTAPYSFTTTAGVLPTGVTLASDGTLSGVPTVAGSYVFTLEATDAYGATGSQAFTVVIDAPTIVITPAAGALPAGSRTVAYSQTFTATGGAGSHTFTVTGGALPTGLTLSPEGVLSGTPTAAGDFAFEITPRDSSAPAYAGPAVAYTLSVGTPVAVVQPKTVSVVGGQSVTIDASEGAVGLDLTSAQVATDPAHGAATVNGLVITYTADGTYAGTDSFTYTVTNPGGVSAPATVSITVQSAVRTAPNKTVTIMAGQTATVELTDGAFGSPFTGAAVVSVSPSNAGVATVAGRVVGGVQLYDVSFKPDNAFTGEAVVSYTLSNAFATSEPGTVTVTVEERPDPTLDAEVSGLVTAQSEAARRFATAQMANVNRRLEQRRDNRDGGGFSSNLSLGSIGGSSMGDGMANDPSELRKMQESYGVMGALTGGRGLGAGGSLGFDQGVPSERRAEDIRSAGDQGERGPWGVWVSGAATFGRADEDFDREGFKFNTDGLTIGVDRRLNDKLVFGGTVGWATDTSKIGSNGTRSEADAWSASLYGSFQPVEKAYFDIVLGYGKLDFDSKRYVTASGDFAYGQRDGDQWFGSVTAGWDYRYPQGLHLSPYGRIEATQSTLAAFTEEGGGAFALAYDEQTMETLTGAIGLRGDYAFRTKLGRISPSFRIEYAYDLQGSGTQRIRYADWLDGNVYDLDADPLDKNRMLYGLGLDLARKSGMQFGIGYEGMLSGDQTSGTLRLKLQTPF